MPPRLALTRDAISRCETDLLELRAQVAGCGLLSFSQDPLRAFAEVEVAAGQAGEQLSVALLGQIEARRAWCVLVAQPVEAPLEPVDAFGIAGGVLGTMIAI